ncbi:MAG: hypothetical protein Kow0099_04760 [Candidatus Abyssubacteria bacterium]
MRANSLSGEVKSRFDAVRRASSWTLAVFAVTLSLIHYTPSLSYFFAQDDFLFLFHATQIELSNPLSLFVPLADSPFYRPFSTSTYFGVMLRIFGLQPLPYHFFSLALFCGNVVLLLLIGSKFFGGYWGGFFTASYYLTRGTLFDVVSWVSGIQDLLMSFFVLLSMALYLRYRERDAKHLLLPLFAFVPALLSKETAVVFPFFLVAYELLFGSAGQAKRWFVPLPFFLLAGIFLAVRSRYVVSLPNEGEYATGFGLFWLTNLVNYARLCVNLLLLKDIIPRRYESFISGTVAALAVLAVVVLLLNWRRRGGKTAVIPCLLNGMTFRYAKHMAFGLFLFLFGVIPVLQFKSRVEAYYLSLACIGASIIFAAATLSLTSHRLRTALLIVTVLVALFVNIRIRTARLSHVGRFAPIARSAIEQFTPLLESASSGSTLYVAGSDEYLRRALALDWGVKVFFPNVTTVIFEHHSPEYELDGSEIMIEYNH